MARQSLDSLLGNTAVDDTPAVQTAEPKAAIQPKAAPQRDRDTASAAPPKSQRALKSPVEVAAPETGEAKYLTLIRKEARLREEQYADLTDKSRQLNRAKKGGERITENTLIRVAIDLLWAQVENLQGADESELRKSVGL